MERRGSKVALARQLIVPIVVVLILAILIGGYLLWSSDAQEPPLTKAEKTRLIALCAASYKDPSYAMTTTAQCDAYGAWDDGKKRCLAWVTGSAQSCTLMSDYQYAWCTAEAAKDPVKCTGTATEHGFCEAFVARDPAKCDAITDTYARYECFATLRNDVTPILNDVLNACINGEELVPSATD